jgi:hypothetical protein
MTRSDLIDELDFLLPDDEIRLVSLSLCVCVCFFPQVATAVCRGGGSGCGSVLAAGSDGPDFLPKHGSLSFLLICGLCGWWL